MKCPNCNSSYIYPQEGSFSKNHFEGFSYLSVLLDSDNSISDFRNRQIEFSCKNCHISFLSPWLNIIDRNVIYNKKKRVHNSGWVSLENSIAGNSRLNIQKVSFTFLSKAIDELSARNKSVKNYAEFNCPFSGPRLFFFSSTGSLRSRLSAFKKSVTLGNNTSIPSTIETFLQWVNLFLFSILILFRYFRVSFYRSDSVNKDKFHKIFSSADLLLSYSTCFWSGNCVRYNNTCTGLSNSLLFQEVTSIDTCLKKYDLVFASNVLDHVDKPSETIEMLMNKTDSLVIQVHTRNSIGFQHLYALNSDFFENLKHNFDVIDLGVLPSSSSYSEQGFLLVHKSNS